jgi:acyl phosphate:glycerol-3-phosphate acyltransferase
MIESILVGLCAYLAGSISSAILTCKIMGLPDPRTQGSNNPGATNVLRFGGKRAAAMTLFGDMLKGLLPVLAVYEFAASPLNLTLAGLGTFLGHLYPIFFRLQGGKGVATAMGVMIAIHWTVGCMLIGTWFMMAAIFKISSLSALTAFLLAPVYVWLLLPDLNPEFFAGSVIISCLIFWRHRSNIRGLLAGTEGKIKT